MTRATDSAITPGPELTKLSSELHAPYHEYDKASAVASNPRPPFFTFASPPPSTSRLGGVATTAAARPLTGPLVAPRRRSLRDRRDRPSRSLAREWHVCARAASLRARTAGRPRRTARRLRRSALRARGGAWSTRDPLAMPQLLRSRLVDRHDGGVRVVTLLSWTASWTASRCAEGRLSLLRRGRARWRTHLAFVVSAQSPAACRTSS